VPRTRPSQTVEHRVTLGGWERAEAKKYLAPKWATALSGFAWPIAIAGLAGGIAMAGKYIGEGLAGILPDGEIGETREDGTRMAWWEPFIGKREYTFNEYDNEGNITGTNTTKNYLFGVPIFGPMSGAGINMSEGLEDWWKEKSSQWAADTIAGQ